MKRCLFQRVATSMALGLAICFSSTAAQTYPDETIRLIVPYKPGGGTDTIARAFAAAMEEIASQSVVVENIPGSAGINGMLALAKAEPDGYTIAINGSSDVSGAVAFRDNAPIGLDDFVCAGGVFNTPAWILSHKDNGYSDLGDFIAAARANPGELNFGITGSTSATDFVASMIKGANDLDFNIINFGGGGPLKKAILANQINAAAIISPVLLADVKAGEINVLAAAGDLSGISHVPAQGTKHVGDWNDAAKIDIAVIRGIWMPAAVDEKRRAIMESLVAKTVASDSFTDFAISWGYAPYTQSGADYCARLPKEVDDLTSLLDTYMQQ